ncbi:Isopenicillin N synthase [Dirofilaria immitis]
MDNTNISGSSSSNNCKTEYACLIHGLHNYESRIRTKFATCNYMSLIGKDFLRFFCYANMTFTLHNRTFTHNNNIMHAVARTNTFEKLINNNSVILLQMDFRSHHIIFSEFICLSLATKPIS